MPLSCLGHHGNGAWVVFQELQVNPLSSSGESRSLTHQLGLRGHLVGDLRKSRSLNLHPKVMLTLSFCEHLSYKKSWLLGLLGHVINDLTPPYLQSSTPTFQTPPWLSIPQIFLIPIFREVDLRSVVLSPRLATLWINLFSVANLVSVIGTLCGGQNKSGSVTFLPACKIQSWLPGRENTKVQSVTVPSCKFGVSEECKQPLH